jgi:adenine-specific DNA methylase
MKLVSEVTPEKLRGSYYTPPSIAKFILKWGIKENTSNSILEPSCGDGVFLQEIKNGNYEYQKIVGIEIDAQEAAKAKEINLPNSTIIQSDFYTYCNSTNEKFDLIIGNPPYIRYQFFDKEQQVESENIFIRAGLKYSKLTNAWVSFVVGCSLMLNENGGKLAFVVPVEILQVSYAKQLRSFLAQYYNKINIISFKKLVFPDIQQEVVLLLCEKDNSDNHQIDHLELYDATDLENLKLNQLDISRKRIDFKSNKWTFYFLSQKEIDFLENIAKNRKIPKFGKYAKVEVGITTGANDFFTVPKSLVEEYELENYAKPMVGRSVQVDSLRFTKKDWLKNKEKEAKAHLLVFPSKEKLDKKNGAVKYIEYGEEINIHKGYKTRIRQDWFVVPSLKISPLLFIRRNNLYPRLIVNEAEAYTTDTMHRVYPFSSVNQNALVASYYNSLSLASAEVSGRSHGGGVLELMPKEAESILLPYHEENENLINRIDELLREKKSIHEILEVTNQIILQEQYQLTKEEVDLAHGIWLKLSTRRLNRGKK